MSSSEDSDYDLDGMLEDMKDNKINSMEDLLKLFSVTITNENKIKVNGEEHTINFQYGAKVEEIKVENLSVQSPPPQQNFLAAAPRPKKMLLHERFEDNKPVTFNQNAGFASEVLVESLLREDSDRTHLIFYHASPIKPPPNCKSNSDLPLLDFMSEYSGIKNALRNVSRSVRYKRKVATAGNIARMIEDNPIVLHFSGHGVKVKEDPKSSEDYLVIEDQFCGGQEMSQTMLKNLFSKGKIETRVAVVLSCHSKYIGEIFRSAGISHVI